MNVLALKKQFSLALFSVPGNPFKAACIVFPDDISLACKMAVEWNNDSEVLEEIQRLTDEANKHDEVLDLVPNKTEALQLAWDIANNVLELGKDRVAALKLFAEISNFMPDKTVNKNVVVETKANRVMIIKDHGSDDDWERKAIAQQKVLSNAV